LSQPPRRVDEKELDATVTAGEVKFSIGAEWA
jgi:hypothetical protein